MPWCLIARQWSCAVVLVACAYAEGIRKIRINTRDNCTEKVHENGGKKSAKSLAQAGNCYIRRPLAHSSASHVWRIRKVIISNRVWVHTGFPFCVDCPYYRRVRDGDARITGDLTMEICVQLRPSGRNLDNFRVALGGSKILAYEADLGQLSPIPFFKGWRVKGHSVGAETWPSGPTSSPPGRHRGHAGDGGFRQGWRWHHQRAGRGRASYRFPVVVGEDNKPRLQMQKIWISRIRTLKSNFDIFLMIIFAGSCYFQGRSHPRRNLQMWAVCQRWKI